MARNYNDFGGGFSQAFNNVARLYNQQGRLKDQQARTQTADDTQRIRQQLMQEQIKQMPQQLQLAQENARMRQQGLDIQQQMMQIKLMQLKAQLDSKGKSTIPDELNPELAGMTPNDKNQAIHSRGTPYQMYIPGTDKVAKFVYSKPQQTKDQATMAAMIPLATSIKNILPGAEKYMNLPGQFKQYKSAISGYLSGNATPKDTQFMKDSGITSAELMQLTESISKLQGLAKTDKTFEATYNMIAPRKGDTAESYTARLSELGNEFERRYWEASFRDDYGSPAPGDDGSMNALDWMQQSVEDGIKRNKFGLQQFDQAPTQSTKKSNKVAATVNEGNGVTGGKSGHVYSPDEIQKVADATGKSYDEVAQRIRDSA